MTMKTSKTILAALLAAMTVTPLAVAPLQAQTHAQAQHVYTQAELDQMLAPIALYPDGLLSQVLMAATYPIEVVEAARWSRANPGLQGDDAVRAVQNEDWDPSVKSLVAFPQILQRMDEKLEWTRSLGDAFLAQEPQMMDQVQLLRQRAEASGNLRSDEQIRVVREGPVIVVRPARPEYIYVPYYDPLVVYGTWWWPDYRPVYWAPWPGYARPRPSYAFWWGRPTGISLNFFFGDFDWGRRHVRVAYTNSYYYRQPYYWSRTPYYADRTRWQHDPHHRRGVTYRAQEVRQRFASTQLEARALAPNERRVERRIEMREDRREALREERRDESRVERRADRQAAPAQARTQAPAVTERRDERRAEQRSPEQSQRIERRQERREEPRVERQATPAQAPAAQPRTEQRDDRRAERQAQQAAQQQASESQRQAQQAAQQQTRQAEQAQRQAQQQAQRQAQEGQRQAQAAQRQAQQQARQQAQAAQRQSRQEQRANMPAAQAPQTPRAERQEQREERREKRQEQRKDRDKG